MLVPGKKIAVIALSGPCERARFEVAMAQLCALWPDVSVALDPCANYGKATYLFSSASVRDRVEALENLFEDDAIGAIIAARGAYGALELLPHLNFGRISKNPKPLVGFSDTTGILVPLRAQAGVPAIHGPAVESTFGRAAREERARASARALISLLQGSTDYLAQVRLTKLPWSRGADAVSAEATGGSLSLLAALCGTPWAMQAKGKIVFLEEAGERPFRVHRMLQQLIQSGSLEGATAILLGDFVECLHPNGAAPSVDQVIESLFAPLGVPVFRTFPGGHGPLNLPLPFFGTIRLDVGAASPVTLELRDFAGPCL